jgi:hypothetical protein
MKHSNLSLGLAMQSGEWWSPMAVKNALAYYDTATITAVKSFIVQAPGGIIWQPIFPYFLKKSASFLPHGCIQNVFYLAKIYTPKFFRH